MYIYTCNYDIYIYIYIHIIEHWSDYILFLLWGTNIISHHKLV